MLGCFRESMRRQDFLEDNGIRANPGIWEERRAQEPPDHHAEGHSMETPTKASPSDRMNTMTNASHSEGSVAKAIESQTAKLPSDLFLWAAFGSMAGSLALQMMGKKEQSNFVGQWAPTLLILGLYNKIVKVAGSD
jgi:hypothetical protein